MTTPTSYALTYRVRQAASMLSISRATIYRLASAGKLKLVKISTRASGITAESLHKYMQDCTQ